MKVKVHRPWKMPPDRRLHLVTTGAVRLLACGVVLAACNPYRGARLPAASCRADRDCEAALVCRLGTCSAAGWVEGKVRLAEPYDPPPGPLTLAVYREGDLGPEGPHPGSVAAAGPYSIAAPEYPQPYRFDGLPTGAHVVTATVREPRGAPGPMPSHWGMRRFVSFGGTPFTRISGAVESGTVDVVLAPNPAARLTAGRR